MWIFFFLFIAGIVLGWLLGKYWWWSTLLLLSPVYVAMGIFNEAPSEKTGCAGSAAPCFDITKSEVVILLPVAIFITLVGIGITYLLSKRRVRLQNAFNGELNKNPEASEYLISKMAAENEEARSNATAYGKSLIDEKPKNE